MILFLYFFKKFLVFLHFFCQVGQVFWWQKEITAIISVFILVFNGYVTRAIHKHFNQRTIGGNHV